MAANEVHAIVAAFIASEAYNQTFPIHALIQDKGPAQPHQLEDGYYVVVDDGNIDDTDVNICGLSWTAEGLVPLQAVAGENPVIPAMLHCRGNREAPDHLPHWVKVPNGEGERLELWWLPDEAAIREMVHWWSHNEEIVIATGVAPDEGEVAINGVSYYLHDAITDFAAILDVFNVDIF